MQKDRPEAVLEMRKLLEKSLSSSDYSNQVKYFQEGIDGLNDFLTENLDSPHKQFVYNIKLTYSRKLLERLPALSWVDIVTWLNYQSLFANKIKEEIEENIKRDRQLEKNLAEFGSEYQEILELLK